MNWYRTLPAFGQLTPMKLRKEDMYSFNADYTTTIPQSHLYTLPLPGTLCWG